MTVPAVLALAVGLTVTAPVWIVVGAIADVVQLRWRLPIVRLLSFGVCWAWLEVGGVATFVALWLTGRGRDARRLYALERWWVANLLGAMGATCGIRLETDAATALSPGPVLLFVRHASLADSLVTAHVVLTLADMQTRFVLKRELLIDPCLDIVGHRLPNHFLNRDATDSAPELSALRGLVVGMGSRDAGIIFPEGTRANSSKRSSALARIGAREPERASRVAGLKHLLPPRPSGALAMAQGALDVDVVLAWHVGFEGLDTFGGILRALARRPEPIRFVARRFPSTEVPRDEHFVDWLDAEWLRMDAEVDQALAERRTARN